MPPEYAHKLSAVPEIDRDRRELKIYKSDKKRKKKKYIWTQRATTSVMIMVMAVMAFAVIIRYTVISDMNAENRSLSARLVELKAETEQSEVELNKTTDLKTVEQIAKSELNMKTPDGNQVVSLVLDMENRTVKPNKQSGGFINGLRQLLSGVMEYLY